MRSWIPLGRVTASTQSTLNVPYRFSYTYNHRQRETEQYPSGFRKMQYCYDALGRPKELQNKSATGLPSYASGVEYGAHGGMTKMTLGNGTVESRSYSADRQQLTQIKLASGTTPLLTLDYNYCASGLTCATNNGNLLSQGITRQNGSWANSYEYDLANRLTKASEAGTGSSWARTFGYDLTGNMWVAATAGNLWGLTGETPQAASWFQDNKNQIHGWTYDAAGNLQGMGSLVRAFTYDVENRQASAAVNGVATTYSYDGEGRRVVKTVDEQSTVYVYNADGELAAEYGAAAEGGTPYLTADALGSTRMVTTVAGTVEKNFDYLPFGEDIRAGFAGRDATFPAAMPPGTDTATKLKPGFTGNERDGESGLDYSFARYFLAGNPLTVTYPSGRVVSQSYDALGRAATVSSGMTSYASGVTYAPHGALSKWQRSYVDSGGQTHYVTENTDYNARLQPVNVAIQTKSGPDGIPSELFRIHNYFCSGQQASCTTNNGNVMEQDTFPQGGASAGNPKYGDVFTYDTLNRLSSVTESGSSGFSQSFGFDAYGNRWISGYNGLPGPDASVPVALSWFQSSSGGAITNRMVGATYDKAGNLKQSGLGGTMTYDAENRMLSLANYPNPGSLVSYEYDADGHRVTRADGASATVFAYDVGGQLLAEYGGGTGQASTQFLVADHLGSTRLITDVTAKPLFRYDYLPFGEFVPVDRNGRTSVEGYGPVNDAGTIKFTGKERDAETGLDYFGARYFSSAQGRFTSADVPFAGQQVEDPQSWNMYAYGRNNPLLYTDPTGRSYSVCDSGGKNCADLTDSQYSDYLKASKGGIYQTAGGTLYAANQDGSATKIGSATYYNEQDKQAAGSIANQVGPLVNGLGYGMLGLIGGGTIAGSGGIATLGTIEVSGAAPIATGSTAAYASTAASGSVQYVGITGQLAQRAAQHAGQFAISAIPGLANLSRADARAVEQTLIEFYGLAKNGGTLLNKINSIAPSNPAYSQALQRGAELLHRVGYPGF